MNGNEQFRLVGRRYASPLHERKRLRRSYDERFNRVRCGQGHADFFNHLLVEAKFWNAGGADCTRVGRGMSNIKSDDMLRRRLAAFFGDYVGGTQNNSDQYRKKSHLVPDRPVISCFSVSMRKPFGVSTKTHRFVVCPREIFLRSLRASNEYLN